MFVKQSSEVWLNGASIRVSLASESRGSEGVIK